jgi:hypothetical protein
MHSYVVHGFCVAGHHIRPDRPSHGPWLCLDVSHTTTIPQRIRPVTGCKIQRNPCAEQQQSGTMRARLCTRHMTSRGGRTGHETRRAPVEQRSACTRGAAGGPCRGERGARFRGRQRSRRRAAPGPVLPCPDPEPRALRVGPAGPLSPSGPPPAGDLPAGIRVYPRTQSLERGVLAPDLTPSNTSSIIWDRARARHTVRCGTCPVTDPEGRAPEGFPDTARRHGPGGRPVTQGVPLWHGVST